MPSAADIPFSRPASEYGIWGLRSTKELNPEQRLEITDMCASILGGLENLERKRNALEDMQMKMERLLEGESVSNVIAFQRRSPTLKSSLSLANDKRYSLRLDCLIEGKSVDEIHRMATELHSQSQRRIFLDYRELSELHRTSLTHLLSLGPIHLFIPTVHDLSPLEQEMLRHMTREDSLTRPLVMAGTILGYADLLSCKGIDAELVSHLARAYIKLTRPFSEYKQQGLIHYFLDTLSSSPT
jgi:hypothetical protein